MHSTATKSKSKSKSSMDDEDAASSSNAETTSTAEQKATDKLVASAKVYSDLVHKAVAAQREAVAAMTGESAEATSSAEERADAAIKLAASEKAAAQEAAKATINYSSWPDCLTASARLTNGTLINPPGDILTMCQNCMNYVCNYDPSIPFYDQSCPPMGRSLQVIPPPETQQSSLEEVIDHCQNCANFNAANCHVPKDHPVLIGNVRHEGGRTNNVYSMNTCPCFVSCSECM